MTDFGLSARNASETIALRGVDVSARIAGLLAETTVTQKYRNDTDANLELAYTWKKRILRELRSGWERKS